MSKTSAGLVGFVIVAVVVVLLFKLCTMSETGHGSRLQDLDEALKRLRRAKSLAEKLLIYCYFSRALARGAHWAVAAAWIAVLVGLATALFGTGWDIFRDILRDILQLIEKTLSRTEAAVRPRQH